MPMPKPNKGENEKDFVSRFMGDAVMVKDYPDEKQRAAVAYSTYRGNEVKTIEDKRNLGKEQYGR